MHQGSFYRPAIRRQHIALTKKVLARNAALVKVDIVTVHAGVDGSLLSAAVANGARGIVVQGLGAGNVNQPMYLAIENALAKNVVVVIARS